MNQYRDNLERVKLRLKEAMGDALEMYQATESAYHWGFYDGLDMCVHLLSEAILEADKEENNG